MPTEERDALGIDQTWVAVVCLIVGYSAANLFLVCLLGKSMLGISGGGTAQILMMLTFVVPPMLWMVTLAIGTNSRKGCGYYLATFLHGARC